MGISVNGNIVVGLDSRLWPRGAAKGIDFKNQTLPKNLEGLEIFSCGDFEGDGGDLETTLGLELTSVDMDYGCQQETYMEDLEHLMKEFNEITELEGRIYLTISKS